MHAMEHVEYVYEYIRYVHKELNENNKICISKIQVSLAAKICIDNVIDPKEQIILYNKYR